MEIGKYKLVMTCSACPEQYDVFLGDEQVGYLRLRHGYFYASVPDCSDNIVYEAEPMGDDIFDREEGWFYLSEAVKAIDNYRKTSFEREETRTKVTDATININIRTTLWQAIKIRISGIFKKAISFRQVGEIIKIDYKEQ